MSTTLIVGCGDLGTEIGLRLASSGHRVIGWRRNPPSGDSPIEFDAVDVTSPVTVPADVSRLVICAAPRRDGSDDYEATYLNGMRHVLDGLRRRPERAVLVSSTGVYGDLDGRVDEDTPIPDGPPRARTLLAAERMFLAETAGRGTVLRCGGIYGPGRTRLIDLLLAGEAALPPGPAMTNRIHRDDAAAAVVHLLGLPEPAPVYLGVDERPAELAEVLTFLAERLGLPRPPVGSVSRERGGTRACDSSLLRASGFAFAYPDYRAGYADMLDRPRQRHP